MYYDEHALQTFCGNTSANFWDGNSVGFCMSEIAFHIPVSCFLIFISSFYIVKIFPSLAFEWPFTKLIVARLVFDFAILMKTVPILFFFLAALYVPAINSPILYITHLAATVVSFMIVTTLDFFHSKSNSVTSRGSRGVLFVEIAYFYVTAIQMWSGLTQQSH